MLDQTTPPFRVGDVAYTARAPGGYANAAAVPVDPAFAGDVAYAAPSLGGEFQPGSGAAAPTGSPISKGADADGGVADLAAIPRIDAPTPPAPVVIPPLSVTVSGFDLIFEGQADALKTITVTYEVNGDAVPRNVVGTVPSGTSAGVTAAQTANRMNAATHTTGSVTSNAVHVGTKTPHVLDSLACVIS